MSELIVPPTLAVLLTAFTSCFQERSYLTFQWLVLGWVECQGRHTITTVALASGALGQRHISVFHRFFSRASWSLDALGHGLFGLALAWVPTDQPLVVLGDDTLARKGGKSIALASMQESEQNRGRRTTGERATDGMMAKCLSRPRTLSLWCTSCALSCAVSAR